jgi:amino acid transporter
MAICRVGANCSNGVIPRPGNELLVNSAPPGVVLIFVVVVACTYAIPSALVSAELSTYIPEDGGAIVWAERAFGFTFAM